MAACRRVYDSRHLQADCKEPGSAPEPHAWQSSMGYLVISGTREDASPTSPSADRAQPLLFVTKCNNALANCRCCAARIRRVNNTRHGSTHWAEMFENSLNVVGGEQWCQIVEVVSRRWRLQQVRAWHHLMGAVRHRLWLEALDCRQQLISTNTQLYFTTNVIAEEETIKIKYKNKQDLVKLNRIATDHCPCSSFSIKSWQFTYSSRTF